MFRITMFSVLIVVSSTLNWSCKQKKTQKAPKNVILVIGDGMGTAQVTAAIVRSQAPLHLQSMSVAGFSKTWSASDLITDSGAGGTALACGQRTYNGAIGVSIDSTPMTNITEILGPLGISNGIVATCAITHATPASFYAHQKSRNWYEAIAADLPESYIHYFSAGGLNHFAHRSDSLNYIDSLISKGYSIFPDPDSINSAEGKIGVFYADEHPDPILKGRGNILARSVTKGLEILSKDTDGFFLMVEGSQIDWGGHANDIDYVVSEMIDFDQAIGVALDFAAKDGNTLVIVTADHETGGLSITGGHLDSLSVSSSFAWDNHTATMVPIFAYGPGAEAFGGIHENIDIHMMILEAFKVNK